MTAPSPAAGAAPGAAAAGPAADLPLLARDRAAAERLSLSIAARRARSQPTTQEERRLAELCARSAEVVRARDASVPALTYPADLPVVRERAAIEAAVLAHPVVVVCGETGSGKTTQLPKILLGLGRGRTGAIGHTQPRRIAARAVAARIAEELGVELGRGVGFKVRFTDRSAPETLIKVMTDGILLAEIRDDPDLARYDTLIVDEAHERSLNIDFLLGYLRGLLARRPDLKLVITSATIDPARFAEYFGGAPVVTVEGRGYPIETRYRPPGADDDDAFDPGLSASVVQAVGEILAERSDIGRGDVLVFLPGEREIRETAELLEGAYGARLDVLPLYSRLSWAEQNRVFERHGRQRVVLATNVAETSLTVPGIRAVVDSGLARISRYSPRAKIQRLPVEPVSRASADQRRGRCGRVGTGLCIRLYAEDDYAERPLHTPPEVLRTNLASVILQLEVLGLGACGDFPFMDPPETRLVNDGYRLLQELEAVDDERRVTANGRQIARLPLDPRIGRMLLAAARGGALAEALVLAAALSLQDPRERPPDKAGAADERHAAFADARSDFLTLLALCRAYQAERAAGTRSALRRWCAAQFLSAARLREWEDLYAQLGDIARDLGWRVNPEPADYETLHKAVLCGFLGQVGAREEGGRVRGEYLGARGLRFQIAPGTPLKARGPRYLVCAQVVETQRVYARTCAQVEPEWIEWAAAHLVRRDYTEPGWDPRRGIVVALETVTLYGLTLVAGRRVNYGRVAPAEAREIFVREALVHGQARLSAPFLDHNRALKARLAAEEEAQRRRDVLVDEVEAAAFYLARVPADVHSLASFETWRRGAERAAPECLYMAESDLRRPGAAPLSRQDYPERLSIGVNALPVAYRFDPHAEDDGATLSVPAPLVERLDPGELDWGIPGWRREKVTALIRGLPKAQRRHLVPAPDVAARAVVELEGLRDRPFFEALSTALARVSGVAIPAGELAAVALPAHLKLHLAVVGADQSVIATGRALTEVRRAARAAPAVAEDAAPMREWDCGDLPEIIEVERQGVRVELHPTLVDDGDAVHLDHLADTARAAVLHRAGVARLACLALAAPLRPLIRDLGQDRELMLLHQALGPAAALPRDIAERAVGRCCLPESAPVPRSRAAFAAALERGRGELVPTARALAARVREALARHLEASRAIKALSPALDAELTADLARALRRLVASGFVAATPDPWLDALPRYLAALARRAAKLPGATGARLDAQYDLRERWNRYEALCASARAAEPGPLPAALVRLRWLLEEYAVSVFAQDLRTSVTVSPKRLADEEAQARRAVEALR